MLLPLMIVYFHRLSLSSLVLNIVVSVLLAALVAVAMLALLVSQLSVALAAPLFKFADAIDWTMVHSVDPFSSFGLASLRLPEYSGPAALLYAVYYLPLFFLIIALSHWQPLGSRRQRECKLRRYVPALSFAQLLLLAVLVLHPLSAAHRDGKLRVDFLDVGQGDSALITMPDGTTLLVDGGGNTNDAARRIGETVVSEYLWWRGLSQIDYVLATHADADHIDGLNDVLKNFSVRGALIARRPGDDPEFQKFSQTLTETGTYSETIQAGDAIRFGDVEINVLWPPAGGDKSTNNDSIVLRIQLGERSILLTGDIEQAAERVIDRIARNNCATDVVKVPHHGSKTSSTEGFVLATKPTLRDHLCGSQFEIWSSTQGGGRTLAVKRRTVLTTGDYGTITVTTDGHDLNLKTFISHKIN